VRAPQPSRRSGSRNGGGSPPSNSPLLFFKDGELRDQPVGTAIKNTIVTKLEALAA
jgi:hypothetical protein